MPPTDNKNRFNILSLKDAERQDLRAVLTAAGGADKPVAMAKQSEFVTAIVTPIREAILAGDTVGGIFTPGDYRQNPEVKYPVDIVTPGREQDFYAYTMPKHGLIPERRVEGDYLMVPTYKIANAVDVELEILRDANWSILNRMIEVFNFGFEKKRSDDGWQTILGAAVDRNIVVNDPDAGIGQFTPRLITLMKTVMRRNGGGNSTSPFRSRLTDLYASPEAVDDMRAWGLNLIPDAARERIYTSADGVMNVFGVNIHDLDEFGEGQEYQTYYAGTLAGQMAATDLEICIGLDRQREDSFVMPIRDDLQAFNDETKHRQGMFGMYGWMRLGFGVLDSRRVLIGSL